MQAQSIHAYWPSAVGQLYFVRCVLLQFFFAPTQAMGGDNLRRCHSRFSSALVLCCERTTGLIFSLEEALL